ncbi:MAG: hypothetical protein PHR53_05615, partial [Bacteroidales bacterium]|nr:hypothetical protein [Bacteroidales bacterium]
DSIVNMTLTVNQNYEVNESQTICNDALPFEWNGITFTEAGTQFATLPSLIGCDSVVHMTLTINQNYEVNESQAICNDALPFEWNGIIFTEAGMQTAILPSLIGCDSVVNMTLTVNQNYEVNESQAICNDALPYEWNGITFTEAGTQNVTLLSINGCDSIVELNLTVLPDYDTMLVATICDDETYQENGFNVSTSGVYEQIFTAENGCDSIITLNLTVSPSPINQTIVGSGKYCEGETGKEIRIEGSEIGKIYQLFQGTELLFEWEGNGASHSFGIFENGNYHIWVIDSDGCSRQMGEDIIIRPTPMPPPRQIQW